MSVCSQLGMIAKRIHTVIIVTALFGLDIQTFLITIISAMKT